MKIIITTVGTSLFENYISSDVKTAFRNNHRFDEYEDISSALNILRNKTSASDYNEKGDDEKKINSAIKDLWLKGISKKKKDWFFTDDDEALNEYASAEIESILKISQDVGNFIEVHLLATDTVLSHFAASMIEKFLNKNYSDEMKVHFNPQFDVIENLRVDDFGRFENGLIRLSDRFYQIVDNKLRANQSEDIILNITGGYKGVIPYLSLLGQVNQTKIQYIFEDTGVLIKIPQVPVKQDDTLFTKHWKTLYKLENDLLNKYEYAELFNDLNVCFDVDGDEFCFNFLGEALWRRYTNQYFIFYSPDDTWSDIQNQRDIQRILATKLWKKEVQEGSKNEQKGDKWCYDDGNNNNRIYHLKDNNKFIIYKTFEDEEAAKSYIDAKVDFDKIITNSEERKIRKRNI